MADPKAGVKPGPGEAALRVLVSLHQGGGAGAVNSVLRLALGLRQQGADVRLVCPPGSPVEAEAIRGGLPTHPLPLARGNRFSNAGRLRQLLSAHPVDLVDAHGSRDREAFTWLGLTGRLPVPAVFTRRSWPRTVRLENWLAARVAARVVTLSDPVAAELARHGIPRRLLRVIPNGVMLDRIDRPVSDAERAEWRARIGLVDARPVVAVAARPKDQWVVLRALPQVTTPVRLVLTGLSGRALTGPLPPLPPRHAVVRLPFLPDVRPLYDLVDLVLHPSRWDALPQAVLEAMALGHCVLGSDATGNAVIIRHGVSGWLVPPIDPVAWADAIDRLLGDAPLRRQLGVAARRRAREDFPHDRTVARTLALYQEVLGR